MSYNAIYAMAADPDLRNRVAACAGQQGVPNPESWAQQSGLANPRGGPGWAAAPGWSDAYVYALNTGHESPGKDEAVITDAQILSQVQAMFTDPEL